MSLRYEAEYNTAQYIIISPTACYNENFAKSSCYLHYTTVRTPYSHIVEEFTGKTS
jgi:hypothetical protein